jgi:hypothetical protein
MGLMYHGLMFPDCKEDTDMKKLLLQIYVILLIVIIIMTYTISLIS